MTDQEPGAATDGAAAPEANAQTDEAAKTDAMADIRLLVHRHYIKVWHSRWSL